MKLTKKETEVIQYLLAGQSNKEIAMTLSTTIYSIKKFVASIMEKTGYKSRSLLIASFFLGLYEIDGVYLEKIEEIYHDYN